MFKEFNCQECDDALRKERGCGERGTYPFYIGDEVSYQCPISTIEGLSLVYIRAYALYEKNLLPNGVWGMECNKYLMAMQTIQNERVMIDNKKYKDGK